MVPHPRTFDWFVEGGTGLDGQSKAPQPPNRWLRDCCAAATRGQEKRSQTGCLCIGKPVRQQIIFFFVIRQS